MCEILTRTSEVANLKGECSLCSLKTSQDSVFYRLLAAKENKHILGIYSAHKLQTSCY